MSGLQKKVLAKSNVTSNNPEKITALRTLDVSVITHDMKNHLSPIRMCAEILESHTLGTLNEKQERMVTTMRLCVDKLERLVTDISDAYKLELKSLKFSKTKVDVQNLMDGCADLLRPLIVEKQIELKIEVEALGKIYVDKGRIEQVIINLVKNSVDFVPAIDGKIVIKVEKDKSSNLLFFVEDNGKGIESMDVEKIFVKFYKGACKQSRKYGGSGLGLAVCKGIIEEHGGQIWIDLKHKNGALFKFTIPLIPS